MFARNKKLMVSVNPTLYHLLRAKTGLIVINPVSDQVLQKGKGNSVDNIFFFAKILFSCISFIKENMSPKGSFSAFRFPDFHLFSSVQVKKCIQT